MKKRRSNPSPILTLSAICLSIVAITLCSRIKNTDKTVVQEEFKADPIGFERSEFIKTDEVIRSGETFGTLLERLGVGGSTADRLSRLCGDTFNVAYIRADDPIEVYSSRDSLGSRPEYIVYKHNKIRNTVFKCADSLAVWRYDRPTVDERRVADVTIKNSLWVDMVDAGISPLLIVELADIYAWTVNLFTLQDGDRFRAVFTQTRLDEPDDKEVVAIKDVEFGIFNSGDFQAFAIKFDQGDKGNKYWNEKGESMRKAFLKAPLQYSRISSRFTYHRKHPVSGRVRPHTAVDYAAPSGTPVHTIGDGTVTLCGWDPSGGGNRIKIKHINGYETCYMHLRGFAKGIRSGVRVSQGQTIGYVGSTGTSTGPHLDFRVWKNGTPVDPLKMISPPSNPLDSKNLDSLKRSYSRHMQELEDSTKVK